MFNNSWTDLALSQLDKNEKSESYTKNIFKQLYKVSFGIVFIFIPLSKLVMVLFATKTYFASRLSLKMPILSAPADLTKVLFKN